MHNKIKIILTFSLILFVPAISFSAGTNALQNLLLGVTAKPAAMGDAFCSIPQSMDGMYHNPASVAGIEKRSLGISYLKSFLDQSYTSISTVFPTSHETVTFNINILYFDGGKLEVNYVDGSSEEFKAQTDIVLTEGMGFSKNIFDRDFMFGFMVKEIMSQLVDTYLAVAVALDFGTICKLSEKLNLGLSFQNLGTKIKYDTEEESIPQVMRLGASYSPINTLMVACDINNRINENTKPVKLNLGVEYLFNLSGASADEKETCIAVRAGYKMFYDKETFSLGVGFLWNKISESIDYTMQSVDNIFFHRITLNFNFGPR